MHVLMFLLFFAMLQEGDTYPVLEAGRTIQGMIDDKVPVVETENLLKKSIREPARGVRHLLRIDETGTYTIELRSIFIDAYLVLRDTEGNVLFEDDNGLYGKCAHLVFEADGGKEYRLDACSLNGLVGEYELRLKKGEVSELTPLKKKMALLKDNDRLLRVLNERGADVDRKLLSSVDHMAEALCTQRIYAKAKTLCERALSIRKNLLTSDHVDVGRTYANIGNIDLLLNNVKDAEMLLRKSLVIVEKELGSEHNETASVLRCLGNVCVAGGKFKEASKYLERAYSIHEMLFGEDHAETIESRQGLGMMYFDWGKYEEARQHFEKNLPISEMVLGPKHHTTECCIQRLSDILFKQKKYEESKRFLERLISIQQEVHGPEHLNTARSYLNLGLIFNHQGKYKEGISYLEKALPIFEKTHGAYDPATVQCLIEISMGYIRQGNYKEAEPILKRTLSLRKRTLGMRNPKTIANIEALGLVKFYMGEYNEARSHIEQALSLFEEIYGPEAPIVAQTLSNLSGIYTQLVEHEKSEKILRRALGIYEKTLKPDDPEIAKTLSNLGLVLRIQGRYAEAMPILKRALSINEKTLGIEHPDTANYISNLAALYDDLRNYDEAMRLFEQVLAIREKLYGPDHPITARTLNYMASTFNSQGNLTKAQELYERSLSIHERTLGPEHPNTAVSLGNLASIYSKQENYEKAAKLYKRALSIDKQVYNPKHPFIANGYSDLAIIHVSQGEYAEGRQLLDHALSIYNEVYGLDHPVTSDCINQIARLLMDIGDYENAWKFMLQYNDLKKLELIRILGSLSEQERLLYTIKRIWNMDLLISIAGKVKTSEAKKKAYENLVYWKGPVYRSMIRSKESLARNMNDEAKELLLQLQHNRSQLSKAYLKGEIKDKEEYEKGVYDLHKKCLELERELINLDDNDDAQQEFSLTDLRSALPDSSAVVDFYIHHWYIPAQFHEGELTEKSRWTELFCSAWILRKDSPELVHVNLGPGDIVRQAVQNHFEELVSLRGEFNVCGNSENDLKIKESNDILLSVLWDPIAEHLEGVNTILISPDYFLATMPFEVMAGRDRKYLVEDYKFIYLQDLFSFANNHRKNINMTDEADGEDSSRLLVVGAVDYDEREDLAWKEEIGNKCSEVLNDVASEIDTKSPMVLQTRYTSKRGDWKNLNGTDMESESIMDIHKSHFQDRTEGLLLKGATATEERIKTELPKYHIVHLATHGFYQPVWLPSKWETALEESEAGGESSKRDGYLSGLLPGYLSGIVLAGANHPPDENREDGLLTAEELSWLNLSDVDLVVLSACETGLGTPRCGEGLIGLNRSLMQAGVDSVISSLWKVCDEATMLLFCEFYRYLWEEGLTPAEALRQVKLDMIHGKLTAETMGIDRGADVTEAKSIDFSNPFHWGAFIYWGNGE